MGRLNEIYNYFHTRLQGTFNNKKQIKTMRNLIANEPNIISKQVSACVGSDKTNWRKSEEKVITIVEGHLGSDNS